MYTWHRKLLNGELNLASEEMTKFYVDNQDIHACKYEHTFFLPCYTLFTNIKYILHRPDEKHDTYCNNNLIKPDVFHLKFTYVLCRMSFHKVLDQN